MRRTATVCLMVCSIVLLIGTCTAIDVSATMFKCVSPKGGIKFQDYPCPENNISTQGLNKIEKDSEKKLLGGIHFNPGSNIPEDAFKAYYFNVAQPSEPIATEIVQKIRVKYRAGQFHHIPKENFMGYWIGRFDFQQTTRLLLTLSQKRSLSRVSVDGRKVYQGTGSPNRTIEFTTGTHTIEIEHVNHRHAADFHMTFKEEQ